MRPRLFAVAFGLVVAWVSCALPADLVTSAKAVAVRQAQKPVAFIPTVAAGPNLDGRLDDAVWQSAFVIRRWLLNQVATESGLPAELRLLTDGKTLYVGFSVAVADMSRAALRKPKKGRDEYGGSLLEMFFDPTGKGQQTVQLVANPVGLIYDENLGDSKWNGAWKCAGQVGDKGWSIEVAIPAEDLGLKAFETGARLEGNFGFVDADEEMHSWTGRWKSAGLDYGVLSFGKPEQYAAAAKMGLTLALDREVYDPRDGAVVALARVRGVRPEAAPALRLDLRVLVGERQALAETIAPLPGLDMDLTLDPRRLDEGDYLLRADLVQADKVVATAEAAFRKARRNLSPEGPKAGRIPVTVWPAASAAGVAWPVSTGVPFADGVLDSPDHVRLLGPDGKEMLMQAEVRSRWSRGGSIEWLGVDFMPVLAAKEMRYTLEYGPEVRRTATGSLKCEVAADRITVTTGPMQFTVKRKGFNLLDSLFLDADGNGAFDAEEQVLAADANATPYLVDHEGTRYDAALDRSAEVVVEENGPAKVTILATGWYVRRGSAGERTSCELPTDRLCQFRIRLSAYAGSAMLRCATTTVLTHDSDKVHLRDLALVLPVRGAQEVQVGTQGPPVVWDKARVEKGAWLLQPRWDKAIEDTWREHPRATGWVEARAPRFVAVSALRNLWRLFPKEVEARDGALIWHLWPAHGLDNAFGLVDQLARENIYKLWYAHQGRDLDFRFPKPYYDSLDEECKRTKAFSAYYEAMNFANAQGLAIHNDFVLAFAPAGTPAGRHGATASFLADEDPHAFPDPAYACATGVFGPILHADARFAQVEETAVKGFESLSRRTLPNNEYGQFVFGGEHTYWTYYTQPPYAGVHRVWINGHYGIARLPLVEYVRTGNPVYLRWGRNFSANLRDIGMVHYVSDERRFRYHDLGSMYHCKGFAPWAGDGHVFAHPTSVDWLAYDYYVTGNRRSRDVMLLWVEGLKRLWPGGHGTREGIQPLADMIVAYRMTWDAALIELMQNFARHVFRQPLVEQGWWDYHPLLLIRWYGLTGSEKAVQAYRDVLATGKSGYGGNGHLVGFLALYDNRPDGLKEYAAALYNESICRIDQPGEYGDGMTTNDCINLFYHGHKLPYLLKAMAQFNLKAERPATTIPASLPVQGNKVLVAVREAQDRAIPVRLANARPPMGAMSVTVVRADGQKVLDQKVTPDAKEATVTLTIPADGVVGDYLIAVTLTKEYEALLGPLTDEPLEVAVIPAGRSEVRFYERWGNGMRFYFAADADTPPEVVISSDSKRGMGMELLDAKEAVVGRASHSRYVGKPQTLKVPSDRPQPMSFFLGNHTQMTFPRGRIFVARKPDAVFTPKIAPEALR